MNLKAVHYILLALTAIAVVCQALAPSFPEYANALHAIGTCASALTGALALVSPSAGGDTYASTLVGQLEHTETMTSAAGNTQTTTDVATSVATGAPPVATAPPPADPFPALHAPDVEPAGQVKS